MGLCPDVDREMYKEQQVLPPQSSGVKYGPPSREDGKFARSGVFIHGERVLIYIVSPPHYQSILCLSGAGYLIKGNCFKGTAVRCEEEEVSKKRQVVSSPQWGYVPPENDEDAVCGQPVDSSFGDYLTLSILAACSYSPILACSKLKQSRNI
ncbi:hypothetical protein P7K49_029894 [Saguinus oedipus]|uniref:Uncharacterized protein n=1 Tax=Saguinus oedipus TaxID=9490 RepID=A0ABQ9U8I8_SAGOE|nr:hypothetical protein P7K49_029894 [Saguinus oedipus]